MTESRDLIFHEDPGHGWLEVTYRDLLLLNISDKISIYSYCKQDKIFLEEDCDASVYLDAAKKAGWEVKYKTVHEDPTPIRKYRRYRA